MHACKKQSTNDDTPRSNGDKYDGEWDHGLRHGKGTMFWAETNEQYAGMWDHGIQVSHVLALVYPH